MSSFVPNSNWPDILKKQQQHFPQIFKYWIKCPNLQAWVINIGIKKSHLHMPRYSVIEPLHFSWQIESLSKSGWTCSWHKFVIVWQPIRMPFSIRVLSLSISKKNMFCFKCNKISFIIGQSDARGTNQIPGISQTFRERLLSKIV